MSIIEFAKTPRGLIQIIVGIGLTANIADGFRRIPWLYAILTTGWIITTIIAYRQTARAETSE